MPPHNEYTEEIADDQRRHFLRHLLFPSVLEQAFRDDYGRKVLPGLRGGLLLMLGLYLLQVGSEVAFNRNLPMPPVVSIGAVLLLLLASRHPRFPEVWQPAVVVTFCVLAHQQFSAVTSQPPPPGVGHGAATGMFHANALLSIEMVVVIVGFALTRLRFVWFAVGCLTIALMTVLVAAHTPGVALPHFMAETRFFTIPALAALMFVAYLQERGARSEFLANYQLARERNIERRARERIEKMLHVLSQAIGGIVHDLGNPLTSVRTGAETLRYLAREGNTDEALATEVLDIITDGALMLDYLRLSLLEQTRVLEGKPTPLQVEATSFRHIIEAGTHYQRPKFTEGRRVSAHGDDLEIWADGMKLITVFMNLLGNALKYSDGEVRITWRQTADAEGRTMLVCAVQDRGRSSVGLAQTQAEQLFVPFSRLNIHSAVEGTGLGLISARQVVAAHGGELYIEGYRHGVPASPPFSTAQGDYPLMLDAGFRTAFVVACPIGPVPPRHGVREDKSLTLAV
jgi:signal transduction histidine kinase